jgi:predicted ATPase/class 3 adenylate cyclase
MSECLCLADAADAAIVAITAMFEQPSGTLTLVFTDIEGSTRLLRELGQDAYREALAAHRRIVREAFASGQGYEVDYDGDSFFYAFPSAVEALAAVEQAMGRLAEGPIRLRVGIHTGSPRLDPPKYVGMDVHLAARVMAVGHGGQVLLTRATRELIDAPVRELGEHRLKDFDEPVALFQLGSDDFPPLKTISNTNLPRPVSTFVGRAREQEELLGLLSDSSRLVTLFGPGGSGKTRLALEVASELVPLFRAGVFWVGLEALRDRLLVPEAIAQTLGAREGLAEHIGNRELLLLLDNFEQVVEAAPELGELLQRCPNLKLLVTSRELLGIAGEVEYPVPPLAEPEAVELFCERARLEPDETIGELCRRLDELPLALELAAARTSVLSPAQILERLGQRLDLLKAGRDAKTRQQTLRATIEWSHDLLTDEEQTLFRRLSVFRGGCSLAATEEVADADLDVLQSLVDKSLLRHRGERFSMLETIREYAREQLATSCEEAELRQRHAHFFLGIAEAAAKEWEEGGDEAVARARIEVEHDNLRAGLEWADRSREDEILLRLAAALERYWDHRGLYQDIDTWLPPALERGSSPARARLAVLGGACHRAQQKHDWTRAAALIPEWRSLAERTGEQRPLLQAMNAAGLETLERGDFENAREQYLAVAEQASVLGDRLMEAIGTVNAGYAAWRAGDFGAALDHSTKSVKLFREQGDDYGLAGALSNCGWDSLGLDDPTNAVAYFRESLATLARISSIQTYRGVVVLAGLGAALVALHDAECGALLLAAGARLREKLGIGFDDENEQHTLERAATAAKATIGEDEFTAVWARGETMSPEEIARLS